MVRTKSDPIRSVALVPPSVIPGREGGEVGIAEEATRLCHTFRATNPAPEPKDEAADHHGLPPGAAGGQLQGLHSLYAHHPLRI